MAGLLLASGCASLADRIVEPSSESLLGTRFESSVARLLDAPRQRLRTDTGVGIAYRVVEPGDYGVEHDVRYVDNGFSFSFRFEPRQQPAPAPTGTVILLHGWGLDGASMLTWAITFAEHGYRSVIPDLRSHGGSDRAPAGYGTREAEDLLQLIPHWQAQGVLDGPVYLFGISYGAATALFMGAADASNGIASPLFHGIVAIAPYANAADGIRGIIATMLAAPSMPALARRRYRNADIDQAIADAGTRLDLDLASVDTGKAASRIATCTLLVHGARDSFIPPVNSKSLAALNPQLHYVELPRDSHVTAAIRADWLAGPLAAWFEELAPDGGCNSITLPPDPAASRLD